MGSCFRRDERSRSASLGLIVVLGALGPVACGDDPPSDKGGGAGGTPAAGGTAGRGGSGAGKGGSGGAGGKSGGGASGSSGASSGRGGTGGSDPTGGAPDQGGEGGEDAGASGQAHGGSSGSGAAGSGGEPSSGASGEGGDNQAGASPVGGTAGDSAGGAGGESGSPTSAGAAGEAGEAGAGGADGEPVTCVANVEDPTATIQRFDAAPGTGCGLGGLTGTPYQCQVDSNVGGYPGPEIVAGVSLDPPRFLRLLTPPTQAGFAQDTIAFDVTAQARPVIVADFDFRITPNNLFRADGMGFALLSAANFANGPVPASAPCFASEEAAFAQSIGVGFDVYRNDNDLGDESIRINYSNSISVHYAPAGTTYDTCDAVKIASQQVEVGEISHMAGHGELGVGPELAGATWNHARVIVRQAGANAAVTVRITAEYGDTTTVVDGLEVPVPVPYAPRVWFGARAGGESSTYDLANVRVHSLNTDESGVAFSKREWHTDERGSFVELTVVREGFLGASLAVQYVTADGSATAGEDYVARCGELVFAPGEATKTFRIRLLDDALDEGSTTTAAGTTEPVPVSASENFEVSLATSDPKGRVFGPAVAAVTIVDDEAASRVGSWSPPLPSGIEAIHAALLPNGTLLTMDRLGNVALSEVGGANMTLPGPGYDAFCNGAAFLADGTLLVSGGHDAMHGEAAADGIGVKDNVLFDPVDHSWRPLPDSNEGRWYPTVTTQSDGSALIISGTFTIDYDKNYLPQVYVPGVPAFRDLTYAEAQPVNEDAHGEDLYPRMFAMPNARSIKVGPDPTTWILDTKGLGLWTQGPTTNYLGGRIYGPAVLRGHDALVMGGGWLDEGVAPTNTVEELDLDTLDSGGAWVMRDPMFFPRRQHNATVLADGRVVVTNGCSGAGFSTMSTAVLPAEMLSGNEWVMLPAARIPRCYHSIALLLPDGSLLVGGSGQGAALPSAQNNYEVYYPDYFYRDRPTLLSVPAEIAYGIPFQVQSTATVSRVTLVRLAAVTHSFDENQRYAELPFAPTGTSAWVSAPNDGWLPPGHYVLFVLDASGTPSEGKVVRLH